MLFYLTALLVALADQAIKFAVHRQMFFGQSFYLFGKIVKLTYVRNTGAAFSLFTGLSPYLIVISIIIICAVIYFHYRVPLTDRLIQTGLAFILGGSAGNLIDRLFRGYVVDYIDLSFWPVFNFADTMINLGVFLIIIKLFSKGEKNASDPV